MSGPEAQHLPAQSNDLRSKPSTETGIDEAVRDLGCSWPCDAEVTVALL